MPPAGAPSRTAAFGTCTARRAYITRLCSAASERRLGDLSGFRALPYIAVHVREFPQHSRARGDF
jgi:hypothetical protein